MNISTVAIQHAVAREFGWSVNDLLSARQGESVTIARHAAMYLTRKLTLMSLPQIGRAFGGRDHTTVMAAMRRINVLSARDIEFQERIELLRFKLSPVAPGWVADEDFLTWADERLHSQDSCDSQAQHNLGILALPLNVLSIVNHDDIGGRTP